MTICQQCGMPCEPNEYHPFAACLMFKGCHDSRVVRANLPQLAAASVDAEALARKFHDVYERLAAQFGYETRKDTRSFDPESANGKLMIAVCRELSATAVAPAVAEPDEIKFTAEFLRQQERLQNFALPVYFRAGLLACRELMARFVEVESPSIAASIRANWVPVLGDDPGRPRRYNWNEVAEGGEEGPWTAIPIPLNREACCEALVALYNITQRTDWEEYIKTGMEAAPPERTTFDLDAFNGYTPGPWSMFLGNANGKGLIRIETDHAAPIAGIHICALTRSKENERNGLLIQEAPNLLAEVRRLRASSTPWREPLEAKCREWEESADANEGGNSDDVKFCYYHRQLAKELRDLIDKLAAQQ